MARMLVVSILSGLLSACAGMPDWPEFIAGLNTPADAPASFYSFAWRLSGDREVAPLQVFDNGRQTWLQFAPQQPLPAVFEHTPAGDRPLRYTRQGPYMVLQGVWPELLLRGGHLKSLVQRQNNAVVEQAVVAPPKAVAVAVTDALFNTFVQDTLAPPAVAMVEKPVPAASAEKPADIAVAVAPLDTLTAASFEKAVQANTLSEPFQPYSVSPHDPNLRSALARWAQTAGWMFSPEHWAVDADIPIVGTATFGPDFKLAVQELVAATELADRPLQPCFYSNRVLRIVPYAQQCDRTVSGASAS